MANSDKPTKEWYMPEDECNEGVAGAGLLREHDGCVRLNKEIGNIKRTFPLSLRSEAISPAKPRDCFARNDNMRSRWVWGLTEKLVIVRRVRLTWMANRLVSSEWPALESMPAIYPGL